MVLEVCMQNFSDYIKNNKSNKSSSVSEDCKIESDSKTKENLQSKIDEYSNYSSDKLISEFVRLTIEKKRKGELTDFELEKLKSTITPMLNDEQIKTLENLMQMVKNVK